MSDPMSPKLLNIGQLQDAMADYLPRRPGFRTIRAAMEAGMPYVPDPLGRDRFPTFVLADVVKWWHSRITPKPLVASDAAIRTTRGTRKSKGA